MSILPITIFGDKILRKKVSSVKEVDFDTIQLIKNMFDTMKNANGIGLAANQVGVNKSIFVIDISSIEDYEHLKPIIFINPKIIKRSDEQTSFEEGCLSIPDIRSEIKRSETIKVKYHDADLIEHTIKAEDLLARVIQHEYDHLQGILFTDLLPDNELKKIKSSLEKIKNREFEVDYPITEPRDYQTK